MRDGLVILMPIAWIADCLAGILLTATTTDSTGQKLNALLRNSKRFGCRPWCHPPRPALMIRGSSDSSRGLDVQTSRASGQKGCCRPYGRHGQKEGASLRATVTRPLPSRQGHHQHHQSHSCNTQTASNKQHMCTRSCRSRDCVLSLGLRLGVCLRVYMFDMVWCVLILLFDVMFTCVVVSLVCVCVCVCVFLGHI